MRRPIPGIPIEQQPVDILERMCLWAEARGEDALGRLAILKVIRTRALEQNVSAATVILRPRAFSSFNATDKNRPKLLSAWQDDPAGWGAVDAICELANNVVDPTGGANHYYNPDIATPIWGRGHQDWQETWVHGHHVFGRCP